MKPESRENILQEIAEAKQRIAHLRKKQEEAEIILQLLNERLFQYNKAKTHQAMNLSADSIPAATKISPEDKIVLFSRLFRGREDVYPKLWQNQKTAKKGYSPACSNEWVRGVCEKPRIKCGECPNQAFLTLFLVLALRFHRFAKLAPRVRHTTHMRKTIHRNNRVVAIITIGLQRPREARQ